jgi:hypothetical protein
VKNKSDNVKDGFLINILVLMFSSFISNFWICEESAFIWIFLDMKYTPQNTMLTKERLSVIGAGLERLFCESPTFQQARV